MDYQPPPPPPPIAPSGYIPPGGQPAAKSNLRKWLPWAILGGCGCLVIPLIIAFVIPIFMAVKAATAGPELVATEFLAAAARGDTAAAYEYFSGPLKDVQSYEEFAAGVTSNPHLFEVTDTSYTTRSVDLQGAKLEGTATLSSGDKVPISFTFTKNGENWKLLGYNIGT